MTGRFGVFNREVLGNLGLFTPLCAKRQVLGHGTCRSAQILVPESHSEGDRVH